MLAFTHVREYHGAMTSPNESITRGPSDAEMKAQSVLRDVPTAVPMWREFLVYTSDPLSESRLEEWHVWAGNAVAAQRAVLANLQQRRDDWASGIVASIETGESVYG